MADKTKITYKVIRQSAEVGARFYGVIDNSDPIVAELAMQQIIEYKKLYNYSPKQLAVIVEDVLQGAAELVARDGRSRNVSSLLKFEPRILGTFANTESGITDQKVYVKPRMLKDIKVDINKADFTFENSTSSTAPKISGIALESDQFTGWNLEAFAAPQEGENSHTFIAPLTISGTRLCPDGWDENCSIAIGIIQGDSLFRFDFHPFSGTSGSVSVDAEGGSVIPRPVVASDNVLKFALDGQQLYRAWRSRANEPLLPGANGYDYLRDRTTDDIQDASYTPQSGDRLQVVFRRVLGDGSGSIVEVQKDITIV